MEMRARILDIVRTYPGLHLRAIARQGDTSLNLVQYHIQALSEAGDVELGLDGGKLRAYPPGIDTLERRLLGALREPKRAQILTHLLDHAATHAELSRGLKIGKSTLSFHLAYLAEAELVEKGDAIRLADPAMVRRVMSKHPRTPDAADRLTALWGKLYGE